MPPGLGVGATKGLQVGEDPGQGLLGPDVFSKTFEFGWLFRYLLDGHSLSSLSQAFHRVLPDWLLAALLG